MHITNIGSIIFGKFAKKKFPKALQNFINKTYVKKLNLDMSEFDTPESYSSLSELFIRDFKTPRNMEINNSIFYSMCDSLITECGIIEDNFQVLQIKGFAYPVNQLLGNYTLASEKNRLKGGIFANLYLSPADYHHYHSPCDMKILKATHIPGKLYPVNLKWLNKKLNLFIENERVVLECETLNSAKFFLVFVGALNVGKIRFLFDENIQTNVKIKEQTLYIYDNLHVSQGEELGYFEMGSTVLFFGEKDKFQLSVKHNKKIKFAEELAKII